MVATFHLHCLWHRVKYGNPEEGNTTQKFLSTTRPCCSIEFMELSLFWVILVTYNIGIYICIYIYKVSYIHSFFVIFNCNVFSALHAKHFEIWKNILWNWWVDCFIARSIKWCDILDAHSESILPFMQCFISFQKTLIRVIDCWRDDDEFSWNNFYFIVVKEFWYGKKY